MTESRTVFDPFLGVTATISGRLVDRLRGKYACGPTLPNGEPEFGWRLHDTPPIQHEAAARIEVLESALAAVPEMFEALTSILHAVDAGSLEMNSEEIGSDETLGVPPHPWHEEWLFRARAALAKVRPTPAEGGAET